MKTTNIYERGDTVNFKRRGKICRGLVYSKWASGEGDGYAVMDSKSGQVIDVTAKNIVGIAE